MLYFQKNNEKKSTLSCYISVSALNNYQIIEEGHTDDSAMLKYIEW